MPLTRQDRVSQHTKTSRQLVKSGLPSVSEMAEGIPYIRKIVGKGMYVFYRIGAQIYYNLLTKGTP